jgi:putative transposase
MKASNFSDAQKAFIIKQGVDGIPVAEICRNAGISQATYFNWKKKYADLLPTEMKRLKQLEEENARLKKIVAEPVSADAGLAVVAELGNKRSLDRGIKVSIVENYEWRVSTKFQPELLDCRGALPVKLGADFGRAGEGQLSDGRIGSHLCANLAGRTCDDGKQSRRKTGAFGKHRQSDRREWRLAGRLQHHRAAGGEGGPCLSGDHCIGEVPGCYRPDDTDRLLHHHDALVRLMAGNKITMDPSRLLCEPLDETCAVNDLCGCFGKRFSLFERQDAAKIILVLDD